MEIYRYFFNIGGNRNVDNEMINMEERMIVDEELNNNELMNDDEELNNNESMNRNIVPL